MDLKRVIIVEGEADKKFLACYMEYLNINSRCYSFDLMKTNILSREEVLSKKYFDKKHIIIIVDADKYKAKYLAAIKRCGFEAKNFFTFPDNSSDGTLEYLIKLICLQKNFFECWKEYNKCLKNKELQTEDYKAELYSYDKAIGGKGKETKRCYQEAKNYDLSSKSLAPLKKFLCSIFPSPKP